MCNKIFESEASRSIAAKQGATSNLQFPGLWLAGKALLSGNLVEVLQVLQQGMSSPEHKAFVDSLQ